MSTDFYVNFPFIHTTDYILLSSALFHVIWLGLKSQTKSDYFEEINEKLPPESQFIGEVINAEPSENFATRWARTLRTQQNFVTTGDELHTQRHTFKPTNLTEEVRFHKALHRSTLI